MIYCSTPSGLFVNFFYQLFKFNPFGIEMDSIEHDRYIVRMLNIELANVL